ncbi:RNase H-like domain found in reverse transcriptase [Popillia japonica]|uniref:RNase H-like domain found in reverse transcriptase n=1 Tax=Popillia japonica TaxID=7064 RepID=A0AAW1L4B8_POPJA
MDTQQFQKFLEIQARQQEQITQILQQLIRSQNVSASQSDSTEIEVKSIIKNFKCEKYDSNTAAETFIDYFEAQCRMWGLENKPDNVNFLNAKQIAQYCGYEGEMLDRQLRDRFATGLNHKRLEIELKQKWPDLKTVIDNNEREVPFVQVFAVAQAREAAEKDYYDENDTNVHKIKTKNTYENKRKSRIFILNNKQCKRCGKFKHLNNSCAAFSHTCKECNKKGHFEKLCIKTGKAKIIKTGKAKIKQLSTANQSTTKSSSTDRRVHKMKSDDSDSEYEEIFKTSSTSRGKKINLLINNVNCTMDWDPGASYSIISSEMWEKIGKPFLTKPPKLKAYGNFKLTPRGKTDVQVTIDETTKILPVVVIDNADPMLFGLSWSEAFGMPFPKQVYSISANELVKDALDTNKQLEQIIEENVELFNSSLGKIKNYKINTKKHKVELEAQRRYYIQTGERSDTKCKRFSSIRCKQTKEAILNANALVPYDANKRLYLACDASEWNWKHNEDIIFKQVKEAILNANALVPYDANKRLYLACDASEKGIGGLLFHMNEEGKNHHSKYSPETQMVSLNVLYEHLKLECLLVKMTIRQPFSVYKNKNIKYEIENAKNYNRQFQQNDNVYVRTNVEKEWSPAKVIDRTNKYSYKVVTNDSVERRQHADHIRERNDDLPLIDEPVVIDTSELLSTEDSTKRKSRKI